MLVVSVVGARPQFVKASVVSRAIRQMGIREVLVHTGQHYDNNLSDVFFKELDMPEPDYNLGIGSGSHGTQTGRMLSAIEEVLLKWRPNWTLVYGDTNSTVAAALAAVKIEIPVAHVEAGVRSFNRRMPEEINRVLTDQIAELLFAPSDSARSNLLREGRREEMIHVVGDVMYDVALAYSGKAERESQILERLNLKPKSYILATIHRAENTNDGDRLRNIFTGFMAVGREVPVVLPLHPRTRGELEKAGLLTDVKKALKVIEPVGYLDMVMLQKAARLIATDSGGVQREAYFHKVPCVTLREETEWIELLETGWNRLLPPTDAKIIEDVLIDSLRDWVRMDGIELYGGGTAARRIAEILSR